MRKQCGHREHPGQALRPCVPDEPVSREDLEAVVTCGQWAPSAMNRQEWCFVVVDDAGKIARLAETMRVVLGRDAYDMYGRPPSCWWGT